MSTRPSSSDSIGFENTASGRSRLAEHLGNLIYDGATRWKAIDFEAIDSDQILLFTDGISTLGLDRDLSASTPIYAINSASAGDHDFLQKIATQSGGAYLNTRLLSPEYALKTLRKHRNRILDIKILTGDIADVAFGSTSDPSDKLWLTGRLLSEKASAEIVIGTENSDSKTKRIQLNASKAQMRDGVIRRMWARKQFERFDIYSRDSKAEASRFAQRYEIVTPLTSLIVLETVEDYVRFEIAPPPELKKEYDKLIARKKKDETDRFDPEQKRKEVIASFARKIDWYETNFPRTLPNPPKPARPAPPPVETEPISDEPSVGSVYQEEDEEVFELSPFILKSGYRASPTLAGTRIRTSLHDVGSAMSVVTSEFLQDIGSTSVDDLLIYTVATEVGDTNGNFANQDTTSRMGKIEMAKWSPDNEYYKRLTSADEDDLYALYLNLRKEVGRTPAFFFDAATVFYERGRRDEAILILSNVCESRPGNYLFLRAMGRRLVQFDASILAVEALEETLWQRDFEPQSYFDLGLAYDAAGKKQEALEKLYHIVEMEVDDRFEQIEVIAVMELNRIIALAEKGAIDTAFIDPQLIYPMPMDLRITLSWNTDDTDIDLWVTDPFEEKCFYSHNRTTTGGAMSHDITEGYGPEEFVIMNGIVGEYMIQADYFGSNEQGINLPAVLSAKITRNFSRPDETSETITLRLSDEEKVVDIGRISIGNRVGASSQRGALKGAVEAADNT